MTDYSAWLAVAVEEAKAGLAEGGIPIGGALIGADGLEGGLGFEDEHGTKTLLTFEKLPEITEKASERTSTRA